MFILGGSNMLAAVWEKGQIKLIDKPEPLINDDEILIKVLASGICGTDLHIFAGRGYAKDNIVRGHEFAGRVVKVGKNVLGIKEGDLVAVDPNITCGHCYFCRRGEIHLCENLRAIGVDMDGGFAEYCKVPFKQAYPFSEISPIEGAMMEPVACALHGIERIGIHLGDTVLIVGAGALGLILLQLSYFYGASSVIVVEIDEGKREIAKELGASYVLSPSEEVDSVIKELTNGRGVDVGIEAVGKKETVLLTIDSVRRGGKVLIFGVSPKDDLINISPFDIYYRELTIMGSFVNPFTNSRALRLIEDGRINVSKVVSHKFPLSEIHKAIEVGLSGKSLRVMITFEE
jgi:2-desacetyl-2-hydroxyethyl bacteriochlorophyllide A dehydrogenase